MIAAIWDGYDMGEESLFISLSFSELQCPCKYCMKTDGYNLDSTVFRMVLPHQKTLTLIIITQRIVVETHTFKVLVYTKKWRHSFNAFCFTKYVFVGLS